MEPQLYTVLHQTTPSKEIKRICIIFKHNFETIEDTILYSYYDYMKFYDHLFQIGITSHATRKTLCDGLMFNPNQ